MAHMLYDSKMLLTMDDYFDEDSLKMPTFIDPKIYVIDASHLSISNLFLHPIN